MSLIIALPRERRPSERRVALDPSRVERLVQAGVQVRIEVDCGHLASFHDEHYKGAVVCPSFEDVVRDADIVTKVVCPTREEIACLKPGCVLICILSAFQHLEEVELLRAAGITVLAIDHMPRTTRAQPMDALSSQATVAGYKAALLAAELSPRLFPMLTTAAGTIRPSRVLVIGAGVAGLQAIATARRLGAQVEAYDIRRAAKEQIESLGARMVDIGVEVEGVGGLARPLRKDEKQKQHDVLAEHLARAHVVICAASIPGRRAPRIITEDMVDGMLPESVIVDLAASTGGNCELTHIGEHYHHNDTLIVGPLNLPSHGAVHASEMYSRNMHSVLQLIIQDDSVVLDHEDDIIKRCVVCDAHQINHGPTAGLLQQEHIMFGGAVHTGAVHTGAVHTSAVHTGATNKPVEITDSHDDWLAEPDDFQSHSSEGVRVEQESEHDRHDAVQADANHAIRVEDQAQPQVSRSDELSAHTATSGLQVTEAESDATSSHQTDDRADVDDLTRIEGVGPALQERLYSFGFYRFDDIAILDSEGIQELSVQLELDDEIEKQAWPTQANTLMQEREK